MASNLKELETKLAYEINSVASTMSKVIGSLEVRIDDIEKDHSIMMNHYLNLSNKVNYLEKKVLK
jgi:hypothetical protein